MARRGMIALLLTLSTLGAVACVPRTPAKPSDDGSWATQMLERINAERARVGAPPMATCGTLTAAAAAHSADQAASGRMSHTGSDGSTLTSRTARAGYKDWLELAENVGSGNVGTDAIMDAWMNSPGHRSNLLNPAFDQVGLGRASGPAGMTYWTQDFGWRGTC